MAPGISNQTGASVTNFSAVLRVGRIVRAWIRSGITTVRVARRAAAIVRAYTTEKSSREIQEPCADAIGTKIDVIIGATMAATPKVRITRRLATRGLEKRAQQKRNQTYTLR